jgi:Xaa-Pro aminopeptidase
LENLALVIEAPSLSLQAGTPQPTWYAFELLNWIPFASHLMDPHYLSPQEKQWLVDYHQAILQRLTPRLLEKDALALAWLEQSCQACIRVLS